MHDLTAHLTDEQLSTFLDDRLDAAEHDVASVHLETCSDCSQSLQELTYTVQALREMPIPSLPRSFLIVEAPRTSFWSRLFSWGGALQGIAAAAAGLFVVLLSVDMMSLTSPAAIVPLNSPAQPRQITTAQKAQPTMLPYVTAPDSGPAGASAPAAAAAPPPTPAVARKVDTAAEQRPPEVAEGARLEALTASDASASAAGSIPRLSAATLTAGLIAVLLIVGAVVRTVRKA